MIIRFILGIISVFGVVVAYSALIVSKRADNDYHEKNSHSVKDNTRY